MTTVVNTPGTTSDSGAGLLLGSLLFILIIAVLLYFGWPVFSRVLPVERAAPTQPDQLNIDVDQQQPAGDNNGALPNINVPDDIDVNVEVPAPSPASSPVSSPVNSPATSPTP